MRRGLFASFVLAALLYVILVGQLFFRFPWPWPDESLYADIAKHFAETGTLGIPFFEGYFAGIEQHQHFYPPFYFVVLAAVFKIFPYGLVTLRLSSLAFMIGALGVTLAGARRWFKVEWLTLLAGGLVLLFDPVFVRGSNVGRMDALGIFVSLLSLWCLHFAETESQERPQSPVSRWAFFASGILGGLAFLTHPMVWALPLALALYLGWRLVLRRVDWRSVALVAIGGLVVAIPYLVWLVYEWPFFTEQFAAQMVRKRLASPHGLYEAVKAFEALFKNYETLKGVGLVVYLLGLAGLILGSWREHRVVKFLIFHLAVTLLATYSREMWYPLYWTVTSAFGVVLLTSERMVVRRGLRLGILGLCAASLALFVWFLTRKAEQLSPYSYREYCQEARGMVADQEVVYLASLPDAYFCFEGGSQKFHQFVPGAIPVPESQAFAIMDRAEVFVGGDFWLGEHLEKYLEIHSAEFTVHELIAGGFKLKVLKRHVGDPHAH